MTTAEATALERCLHGKSILLIEQNAAEAMLRQSWLVEAGASVAIARDPVHAMKFLRGGICDFDLLIVDAPGEADEGLKFGAQLRRQQPSCELLVQCNTPSLEVFAAVRALGAGFISKRAARAELLLTAASLLEREVPDLEALAARAERRWRLSRQQTRVLYYNLWSCSNEEIAGFLGISLHTVQEYQAKLRKKTGARTKDGYLRRLLECSGRKAPILPLPKDSRESNSGGVENKVS